MHYTVASRTTKRSLLPVALFSLSDPKKSVILIPLVIFHGGIDTNASR